MTPWQDIEKLEQAVEDFIHAYRMRHVRTTGGIRSGVPTRAEVTALNTALVNSRALPTPPVEGEDGLSGASLPAHASSEAATDTRSPAGKKALNDVWRQIDALGGAHTPEDRESGYGEAYDRAVNAAIAAVEALGGEWN